MWALWIEIFILSDASEWSQVSGVVKENAQVASCEWVSEWVSEWVAQVKDPVGQWVNVVQVSQWLGVLGKLPLSLSLLSAF